MMTQFLEDFGPAIPPTDVDSLAEAAAEAEEQRLAIFEQGYAAGWDDAIKAQAENTAVASKTFAAALKDLSFTYHEAATHMAHALSEFLAEIVRQIVPAALEASVATMISEELENIVSQYPLVNVAILCAPCRQEFLAQTLPPDLPMPVQIVSDPSLDKDQIGLRFDKSERRIDLSRITDQIEAVVSAYSHQIQKDLTHG